MSIASLEKIIKSGTKLTPMMEQYFEIKKNYPDTLVLFRMGDFYELFFEDASEAARILNITLTHRGKLGEFPIPMSGIPHHAAPTYIDRITAQGLKAAICEQIEDPKEAKGVVKRAVTQVVSPGMPFDIDKTSANENKYMISAEYKNGKFYLVAIDYTTGNFEGHIINDKEEFFERIRLISPKEIITYMDQWEDFPEVDSLIDTLGILKTCLAKDYFNTKNTEVYLKTLISNYKTDKTIKSVKEILDPMGALGFYISSTQSTSDCVHIRPFRLLSTTGHMKVTSPTLQGLEILPKSKDSYKESLLGFFDKTKTTMGTRRLKQVFLSPLDDKNQIEQRLEFLEYFLKNESILEEVREQLNDVRDIERILAKIPNNKITASDVINLSNSFNAYLEISKKLKKAPNEALPKIVSSKIKSLSEVSTIISETLNDEIGASLDKGNLIKKGANKRRDKLAKLSEGAIDELIKLEARYREETGIQKLKIKSNNVAGHFIEVSKLHTNKVPKSFTRRQTLVNSERYTTEELSEFEKEMMMAKEKLEKLEREIFKDIISQISDQCDNFHLLSDYLSLCDIFQSFAWITRQESFTRPVIKEDQKVLNISQGWHPLIKSSLREQFVPHDLYLNEKTFFGLITGPNMAGKTTVMREVAIIQFLTQIGSFVPAQKVELGLCDYLFSRLGASDDILKGQSTFMVEMSETAEIIRHSTSRSLIILDEVGRGTSTYDGLSIAWSLVEYFIKNTKALCLFATHYHELIELADQLPAAKNLTVETINKNGDVKFLYKLIESGASQSFGIYVAKLAGIPNTVLKRAQTLLDSLEESDSSQVNTEVIKSQNSQSVFSNEQLSFFPEHSVKEIPEHLKKLETAILKMDLNNMTPLQAMNKLNDLKDLTLH